MAPITPTHVPSSTAIRVELSINSSVANIWLPMIVSTGWLSR